MTTMLDMVELLKTVDVEGDTAQAVAETHQDYERMNAAQMLQGKGKDGKAIGRYRSMSYARMKAQMNTFLSSIVPNNVDLKLTGAFHKGLAMKVNGQDISMTSTDDKADDLQKKYGENIYGLNEETAGTYAYGFALPAFMQIFARKTGLVASK